MKKKTEKPAWYFSILEVENVKSFEKKAKLDLKNSDGSISPWTLILGDNGVGKTTLLHCLAWMIPVGDNKKTDEFRKKKKKDYKDKNKIAIKSYMDELDESNFDNLIRIGDNLKTNITSTLTNGNLTNDFEHDNIIVSMQFEKKNGELMKILPTYHVGTVNSFDEMEFEREKVNANGNLLKFGEFNSFNSPKIFAYSANRHLGYKNIDKPELKDPIYNLISQDGELYDAEQLLSWLKTGSIMQNGKGKATDLLKKIKEILVDLLPDIKTPESIIINSPINDDGSINESIVEIQTENGKVKLFNLSLGYVTMLTWIVDLAIHMLWSFPESEKPLNEPAIVLVDEIDLHLHPAWQREIMRKLTNHFSATQFICTAHSPIMAQASEQQNLAVVKRIEERDVIIVNDPNIVVGWRIGQLLIELFDFDTDIGPEFEKYISDRRKILDKDEPSRTDESDLLKLNNKIANIEVLGSTDDQKILNQIRKAAELLKEKGTINDSNN